MSRYRNISRLRRTRFATLTWKGHWSTWVACRSLRRIFPALGMAWLRSGRGKRILPGFNLLTKLHGRAGGWYPRGAVEAWSRLVDPDSPELQAAWGELSRDLLRAEALVAKARNVERSDPPAARALYRQSLTIAADLPDALAGLKRTPPDAPTSLDAQVLGDRIRLCWNPPAQTAWVRSRLSLSASVVERSSIRRTAPASPRSAPQSLTTCMWHPATRWAMRF